MNDPRTTDGRFITTPRLRMHLRIHGHADGMPLLCLHGSFGSSRWWLPLFECLPDEYCAIAPDLRGCGQSDKPDTGYTVEEQAADLAALVDTLALRDFDLVAHASSGALAIEYLLTHPETARTLTLVDSVPIEGVVTPLEALTLLAEMRSNHTLLAQGLAALAPRTAVANPAFFATLVEDAAAQAPAAFTEIAVALGRWNRFADARALTLPTLLVWGDEDPLVARAALTRTLIAIPGAVNLDVLTGVGHSPMLDAPLALAERLVDFITEDLSGFAAVRSQAA